MSVLPELVERFPLPERPARSLKVGLIGLGGIFEHSHLPALQFLLKTGWPIQVHAICDVAATRIEAMQQLFPQAKAFQDVDALMAKGDCDALMAFTPPQASERIVAEMIKRRLPLFVEKPVCHMASRLDELAAQAEAARVPIQVAYNRRSQPLAQEFRRLLAEFQSGGGLQHVVARFWRARRSEPNYYLDTIGHPLDFLASCFGPLKVQRVRKWPTLPGTALPAGVHVEMLAGSLTVELDSRPCVGHACETYEALGMGISAALNFSPVDIGGDPSSLMVYQKQNDKTVASFSSTGLAPASRSYLRGFAHQMATFVRLATGLEAAPNCTLRDAAAAMRLAGEIVES